MKNHDWNKPDIFYMRSNKANYQTEKGLYLVLYDRGECSKNDLMYQKIFQYMEEHNLKICCNTYEEYQLDGISINNYK